MEAHRSVERGGVLVPAVNPPPSALCPFSHLPPARNKQACLRRGQHVGLLLLTLGAPSTLAPTPALHGRLRPSRPQLPPSLLTRPIQFHVLREKGTEYPGTGIYNKHYEEGTYKCAGCGTPIYE